MDRRRGQVDADEVNVMPPNPTTEPEITPIPDPDPASPEITVRKSSTPNAYHHLSASEKRMLAASTQREASVACPMCATSLMPCDLLGHLGTRCPRELPEPSPRARWLPRHRALTTGASASTLARWIQMDLVRTRGDEVLERDVVLLVAWARALGAL